MLKHISLAVMCLPLVSGCATLQNLSNQQKQQKTMSYVAPDMDEYDAEDVAKDMAQFLAGQLAYAKTTLELEPMKSPFHSMLIDQLAARGFGVTENHVADQHSLPLRYRVTYLDSGIVLRMQYQQKEVSRFYGRMSDGSLSFNNSFSVREAHK